MDEEALQDAYTLFSGSGYKGSIEDFKSLISTNDEALADAHTLFTESGYNGDVEAFSTLIGAKKKVPADSTEFQSDLGPPFLPSDTKADGAATSDLRRKESAAKALQKEYEDAGIKNYEITDKQITAKAAELSNQQELEEAENPIGLDLIPEQIVNMPIADLYEDYKAAGIIASKQIENIEAELERQKTGDRKWYETFGAYADGMLTTGLAIPLYQFDSKEDLLEAQAVKNRTDYLEALPEEKVKELNAYAVRKTGTLSKDSMNVLAENTILEEKSRLLVNNIKNVEATIKKIRDSGEQVPLEGMQHYQEMFAELQGIATIYNQNVDLIESNNEDIGNFYEELDFLKKNYGGLDYYKEIMRLSAADMIGGVSEFASSTMKMSPQTMTAGFELEQFNKEFRAESARQRDLLKPMMSVTEVDGVKAFGKWLAEQTASQIPVITTLAVGGSPIGLTALGVSAGGQKMGELRDEGDYSEVEIYLSGIGAGALEVITERVSLGILSKGKRTLKAVATPSLRKELKLGVKDFVIESTKDAFSEGGAEFVNQVSQNAIDILYLGKQDVHVFDGTIDALASGTAMGGGMSAIPSLIGMGSKAFMNKDTSDKVVVDAKKAGQLLEEVEIQDKAMDEATKKLLKKKASSLLRGVNKELKRAYSDLTNLEKPEIQKLVNIDKKANTLMTQVKSLSESDIAPELKKELLDDLQVQADKLKEQKTKILEDAKKTKKVRPEGEQVEGDKERVGDLPEGDGTKTPPTKEKKVEVTNVKGEKRGLQFFQIEGEKNVPQLKEGDIIHVNGVELEVERGNDQEYSNSFLADLNANSIQAKDAKGNSKIYNASQIDEVAALKPGEIKIGDAFYKEGLKKSDQNWEAINQKVKVGDIVSLGEQKGRTYVIETISRGPDGSVSFVYADLDAKRSAEGKLPKNYNYSYSNEIFVEGGKLREFEGTPIKVKSKGKTTEIEDQLGMSYDQFTDEVTGYIGGELVDKKGTGREIVGVSFKGKTKDGVVLRLEGDIEMNMSNREVLDLIDNTGSGAKISLKPTKPKTPVKKAPKKVDESEVLELKVKDLQTRVKNAVQEGINNTNPEGYAKLEALLTEAVSQLKTLKESKEEKVRFTFLGAALSGVLQADGKVRGNDDTIYARGSIKNLRYRKTDEAVDPITEQRSQRRVDKLTSERIPPAKQTPAAKPKKLNVIVKDISKKLKSTLIYGKAEGRGTIGTYYPGSALVRIKNAGDLDTVAHELGHLLDDRFDLFKTSKGDKKIMDQLTWFSERGGSNPPSKASAKQKANYLKREGLAEFIRAYVANPKEAKTKGPDLYKHFESALNQETKAALKEFSQDYINFANAPYGEQVLSNIETSDLPKIGGFKKWVKSVFGKKDSERLEINAWDRLKTAFTNSMQIANKAFRFIQDIKGSKPLTPSQNFEMMNKLFAGINGKINNFLSKGLRDSKNELMTDSKGQVMNMSYLFEGLDKLSPKALKREMDDVIKLLVSERTLEYSIKFETRELRDKQKEIEGSIKRLESKEEEGELTAEETQLLSKLYKVSGLIDTRLNELKNWKPGQKIKFKKRGQLTGIGGGVRSDIEVAEGVLNEFIALEGLDPERYARVKEGARRYREFADAGLRYAVDSGRLSEENYQIIKENNQYYVSLARSKEVDPGEGVFTPFVTSSKLASVKDVVKKARGGTDVIKNPYISLIKNTVSIIKESDRNRVMMSFVEPLDVRRPMGKGPAIDLSQVGRKAKAGEPQTIKVYKDGQEQNWQFDKDIYSALKSIGDMGSHPIMNLLKKPADLIRNTVTSFPVFALRNLVRDTQSRLILSRSRGKITDLLSTKADRDRFETYGGSQAGFYLTNETAYLKELDNSIRKLTKKGGIVVDPRNLRPDIFLNKLVKAGKKLGEKAENVNRIAEFNSAYKKAKKEGMDDYNAGLYAAYQARDLMDFAVAGTWMKEINKLIPFSNAAVQSIKRSTKGAKERPGVFMYRMALFSILPQFLIRALVASMGDEDEYEELPDYQRDLFYNFKVPGGGNSWVSIPKPFELGVFSSIADRLYSYGRGNKDAFEGATMSTIRTLFPFDETSVLGPFKPLIEASVNKDIFRDRSIVPYWEEDKALELREGTKYASRVSKTLSDAFGLVGSEVDPRKIDHIIKGYTTYYGNFGLSLFDIGKEDSRNQFRVSSTGFMRDIPVSNAKSVKKALDLAEDIGDQNTKPIKTLKGAIKAYYNLDTPQAKKKMAHIIHQYSKQLSEALEKKKAATIKAAEKR